MSRVGRFHHRILPLLALIAAGLVAPAQPASPMGPLLLATAHAYPAEARTLDQAGPPTTVNTCADLETAERHLEREEPDLSAPGPRGRPRLCLLHYPRDEVYRAALLRVDDVEQFRAAKADAAQRLAAAGLDLCRVATWEAWGRPAPRLEGDDRRDLPVECPPRIIAGDPGAAEWLPHVREATARIVERTAQEMHWRPNRAGTIVVLTDPDAAVATNQRYTSEEPGDAATYTAQLLRSGQSRHFLQGVLGSVILLNLVREAPRQPSVDAMRASIAAKVTHEYTHFAQRGLSASAAVPKWFLEGQAVYLENRHSGRPADELVVAARAQRDSTAFSLAELARPADWAAREQAAGRAAVYSRSYAAVAFLVERHGFAATVQLLRDNRRGGYERFDALLAALTGLDLAALDGAVGVWLATPGRVLARDDFADANSGWARQSSDPAASRVGYLDGEYYVARPAGSGGTPGVWRGLQYGDFQAELDARLIPPTEGAYLFLTFRRQENGDRYVFQVDPNAGTFRLRRVVGAVGTTLVDWSRTPAVNGGAAPNRLGVRARGPEIGLLVNGQEVWRLHDDTFGEGRLGFGVGHRTDGPAEGRFDNLVVASVD